MLIIKLFLFEEVTEIISILYDIFHFNLFKRKSVFVKVKYVEMIYFWNYFVIQTKSEIYFKINCCPILF